MARKGSKEDSAEDAALPDCDPLFLKFIHPWYEPPGRHSDRWGESPGGCRADFQQSWRPGTPLSTVQQSRLLTEESHRRVSAQIETMVAAATKDWAAFMAGVTRPSLAWLEAFDRHYDRARIRKLIERSRPTEDGNDYLIVCIELGAVIGEVLKALRPSCGWVYDWPYWESALYDPPSGETAHVFHWAVKRLSEYGVEDGIAEKVEAAAGLLGEWARGRL
ncbi:MAG: hypothetical protein L0216_16280 [Planctomycetales bacterium]|nr:hypothetical protein [Planctomycetales bacterium]